MILSSILPVLLIIIGGGGRVMVNASKRAMAGYSSAATIAEEILSSIRTAQAFGTEDKLAATYDESLSTAQVAGYTKAYVFGFMLASIFACRYLLFGLGFCISIICLVVNFRGGFKTYCFGGFECRSSCQRSVRRSPRLVLPRSIDAKNPIFRQCNLGSPKSLSDYPSYSQYR